MNRYKIALSRYPVKQKLPPGDPRWPKFNASFENLELAADEILDPIYRGQALTTHHKDHWRTGANFLCGQHLGLDFDSGEPASTLANLVADRFIARYAAFAYTTMSHTPEQPRSRVIFLLDTPIYQAKNYALAASALLWMFDTADRQCKDAVRFFYGSPGCQMEYLGGELPLAVVRRLIADYRETGQVERVQAGRRALSATPEQAEVAAALAAIPPWGIDYDDWLKVLMGVHAAFGDTGYGLAEGWAEGKPGEVAQKWRSFKADGNPTGAATVASVFYIAQRFGWNQRPAA